MMYVQTFVCLTLVLISLFLVKAQSFDRDNVVINAKTKEGIHILADTYIEDPESLVINARIKERFRDCHDLRHRGGFKEDGQYYIYPNTTRAMRVVCRFEANNTLTSIMGQRDGSVSFGQNWNYYKNGFGVYATNNFWSGLVLMKSLTDSGHNYMRVMMQDWNYKIKYVYYKFFLHDDTYYVAYFSGFHGDLPDDFSYNSGMRFYTLDSWDAFGCVKRLHGGWWYNKQCTYTFPTGHYYPNGKYTAPYADGIFYRDWYNYFYSMMYIRIDLSNTAF